MTVLFSSSFLIWFPVVFWWILCGLMAVRYIFRADPRMSERVRRLIGFKRLAVTAIVFRGVYAALLTVGQYVVWSADTFTQSFLHFPLTDKLPFASSWAVQWFLKTDVGYFLFYSWGRYWLSTLVSIAAAAAFWWLLRLLKRYRERFFEEGETELGLTAALVVGWPNFVLFVPFVFVSVILVSIVRRIFFKEIYTTLGLPFLVGTIVTLAVGSLVVGLFGLAVLKV